MNASGRFLIGFYGDDFTGSTDAMEALMKNGVRTVLFFEPPSAHLLHEKFRDIQAFGVAGVSRAMSPEEMERELPWVFQALKASGASVVHYKTCSTFDSAPHIGSIGKAIDIARTIFTEQRYVPLVAGVPQLKRYTVFGNHFATVGDTTYRLDRHPVMTRHPVTPMNEADLTLHLAKQTDKRISLMNIVELSAPDHLVEHTLEHKLAKEQPDIVLFDVLDEPGLAKIGGIIWREAARAPLFTAGSSGIEYGLGSYWRNAGLTGGGLGPSANKTGTSRLLVISGSCSPVTEGQIRHALAHGFHGIKIPTLDWIDPAKSEAAIRAVYEEARQRLAEGRSVVVYSALGPEDPSIAEVKDKLSGMGLSGTDTGKLIGSKLGRLCRDLVISEQLSRVLVAGGDTTGFVLKELEISALEATAPVVPGAPLCRCYSDHPRFDGLELLLKGGQIGSPALFEEVKNGSWN